jgi:fluoride exporter
MPAKVLIIAAAGALGAVSRYLVSGWVQHASGARFPWGTLAVNASGCFVMGLLMHLFLERQALSETARLALMVGFLGGYTTFSALGYETFSMLRDGDLGAAALNAAGSVLIGLVAVWAGWSLARLFWT